MRKKIIVLISILLVLPLLSGCYYYKSETTKIHYVKNYIIHDTGVEIWVVSENGEENGFFVSNDNVYKNEESESKVITIHDTYINAYNYVDTSIGDLKNVYLYLSEKEFCEYIKEKYNLEEENL